MTGQYFLFCRQLKKSGRWRIYKNESTSLMSWRGDNERVTVVRTTDGAIPSFSSKEEAQRYGKDVLGTALFVEE